MITNIIEILVTNTGKYPEKTAIIHKGQRISFHQLLTQVRQTAAYFREQGIGKNDRILIFVPMSIQLYTIVLASFHIGATVVFIDAWAGKKRLETACELASVKAFIGTPKAHLLRLFSPSIRKIPLKFITGFNSFTPKNTSGIDSAGTQLEDIALVTFSTGSTGTPKAAKRTHGFLLAQHDVLVKHLKPGLNDIDMPLLPIFVLNNLAIGVTSVIPDVDPRKPESSDPASILAEMDRYNVTSTTGSPVVYEKLSQYCLDKGTSPKMLKKIFLGGAPVFPALAEQLIEAFPGTMVEIVYGSTEAEPVSSISAQELLDHKGPGLEKGLLVGNPIDEIQLKIMKISDGPVEVTTKEEFEKLELAAGETGEICVTGNHVLKEYYNNPEAERANKIKVAGDIWHRTGDAGYLDPKGRLFLMGRVTSRFEWKGEYIYTFPIENRLNEIPGVTIGTIIKIGERAVLVIELEKEYREQREAVISQIKELGIPHDEIDIRKKIPRDPRHNSKIDYKLLREILI